LLPGALFRARRRFNNCTNVTTGVDYLDVGALIFLQAGVGPWQDETSWWQRSGASPTTPRD
jgi:hypothetical protein